MTHEQNAVGQTSEGLILRAKSSHKLASDSGKLFFSDKLQLSVEVSLCHVTFKILSTSQILLKYMI